MPCSLQHWAGTGPQLRGAALPQDPTAGISRGRPGSSGRVNACSGTLNPACPTRRFVRAPLAPLPATSCPAGAARCQSGPAGARCQTHKEGLSATGNTEGVDFRPGKRGHKGPGPGGGMRGWAPAPCQWRLCSEYKGLRGSGASGAVKAAGLGVHPGVSALRPALSRGPARCCAWPDSGV